MARTTKKSSRHGQENLEAVVQELENPSKSNASRPNERSQGYADDNRRELSPEARAKLGEIRSRIEESVGQVVLLMMQQARYRHQTLADLNHLVIEPLLHDRLAIAFAKPRDQGQPASPAPIGAAIWASVGDQVDVKIKEQIKAGSFPLRVAADEWSSGETLWLLDIVAPSRKAASAVLANFRTIAGERRVHLHPIVTQAVDQELLQQLKLS